jgi:hypothetical protein
LELLGAARVEEEKTRRNKMKNVEQRMNELNERMNRKKNEAETNRPRRINGPQIMLSPCLWVTVH